MAIIQKIFKWYFKMNTNFTTVFHKNYSCPHCKKPTTWQNNPFKPFCSERCKLIDFGAWANETYRLPASEDMPFSEELTNKNFD